MHEIQPVINCPEQTFDGVRYKRHLADGQTLSIHAPTAPAFLRLRLCWTPADTANAEQSLRLTIVGPSVADGQAQIDVTFGW
ncbi:MAG: hypothetical protein ACC645_24235, partial [Pirellulales bacterium]